MILNVFGAVSDLLNNVLSKEIGFLTSLSNTPQQAGQVYGFFSDLARDFIDAWNQILG
ncbi:hypothetical protein [Nocardia sp. CA-135398]|uniref:hypothetical protein n=1 Tax=Nocardia sp. CA-135398 TaxID=3239977 RepID=UPI003D999B82